MNVSSRFMCWVDAFFDELERAHPPSHPEHAARLIRKNFQQPWNVRMLAAQTGSSPAQLARAFNQRYEMSPHAFQRAVRLIEALDRVRTEKIEAVALEVGYQSKKNFYQAFKRLTGMTPTEFRKLSPEYARVLRESARDALK